MNVHVVTIKRHAIKYKGIIKSMNTQGGAGWGWETERG